MGLDVHLKVKDKIKKKLGSGIFVRDNGRTIEISEKEWDKRHPGRTPVRYIPEETETDEAFHAHITHNLNEMADKAGLYFAMWRGLGICKRHYKNFKRWPAGIKR